MATVMRANVVLQVKESEVQRYLDSGFSQIDETGKVIKQSTPHDATTLKALYVQHTQRIAELEAEVTRLTAELEATKKATKSKKTASAE